MKIHNMTAFLLAAVALCSCGREELPEKTENADGVVLRAGLVSVQTKTWLDSEGSMGNQTKKVYWSDGDKINVNGQDSTPVSVSDGEKVSEADFHLRSVDGPYNVVYPHDIVLDDTYDQDGCITIALSESQKYHPTTFASGAAIMYGYSESENVALHNLCAAVRVNLTGTSNVSAATVVSESSDAPICGTFKLCPQTGVLTPADGKVSLSLDFEDVSLSPEGTDFYFTIPAGDYSAGLSFYFTNAEDGRKMQCTWKPEGALEAGRLYSFNDVTYAPEAKDIETSDEWEEFVLALSGEGDLGKFLYKDGAVRLGADIEGDLSSIPDDFTYILDGAGHTITRNSATAALFTSVSGEVKNLTLTGNFTATASQGDAPFVSTLKAGGKISGCTNTMTITFDKGDHTYVAGIVKMMNGGTIEDCINDGDIVAKLNYSDGDKNVAVGGIVAQVNASEENIVIKNCLNKKEIKFAPVIENSDNGSKICSVGGIAGWLRSAKSFTLENCDNEGTVTYSAENVTGAAAPKNYPICVGGIIGAGSDISKSLVNNGIALNMSDCDNSGMVINRGISGTFVGASTSVKKNSENRSFTGGIAGLLMGTSEAYAEVSECTNTGEIIPYDLTGSTASKQACYTSVVAGFIGFGGYLDMDNCTVNCTIGNGKRPVMSFGGVIGCAVRPFNLTNSNVYFTGYYERIGNYQGNRAVVAAVPVLFGTTETNTMSIAPEIAGSTISNCKIGAVLNTSGSIIKGELTGGLATAKGENTDDCSGGLTTTFFNSESMTKDNLVCGQGYSTAATDVTVTGFTYWEGK